MKPIRDAAVHLLVTLALLAAALAGCGDDGKELGEICAAHSECASGLCTIDPAADGGSSVKRCTDPSF